MSEAKHTSIEQWIEKEATEAFSDNYEQEIIKEAFNELLTYLGLSGIENPREWVELLKQNPSKRDFEEVKSSLEGCQCNLADMGDELDSAKNEITKLQAELKQAKAEAWEKGYESRVKFIDDYFGTKTNIELPEPTNPYKGE